MPTLDELQPVTNDSTNQERANINDLRLVSDSSGSDTVAHISQLQPIETAHVDQLQPITPYVSSGVDAQEQSRKVIEQAANVGYTQQSKQVIQQAAQQGQDIANLYADNKPGTIGAAFQTVGDTLKWAQKHVGRHMAEGIVNSIVLADEAQKRSDLFWQNAQNPKPFGQERALTTPVSDTAEKIHAAPSIFSHVASNSIPQLLGRDAVAALGGNGVQLQGAQAAQAEAKLPQGKVTLPSIGDVTAAKAIRGAVSMAGDTPFFALTSEYLPIGAKAVAGDIEATLAKESAPALKLAAVKGYQTVGAAIDGYFQGRVLAAKDNQDQQLGGIGGALGNVALHKLGGAVTGDAGAKAAVLANEVNRGALLPGLSWKQYLAEIAGDEAGIERKSLFAMGSKDHDYTFKQATLDKNGDVWELRKVRDTKSGKTRIVYRAPLNSKDSISEFISTGIRHMEGDRDAAAVLIDKVAQQEPGYHEFKNETIKSNPKAQNDFLDNNKILYQDQTYVPGQKQYSGRGTPGNEINPHTETTLNATPTANIRPNATPKERPVLLTVNKKGELKAAHVDEGVDTLTPPTATQYKIGDMVQSPDGQIGGEIVEDRGPTVAIRTPNKQVMEVDKFSVKPVDETSVVHEPADISDPNINQDFEKLTIPRVVKKTGKNEIEVAQMLHDLERKGALTSDGQGGFWVNKKSLPAPKGTAIYYGTSADGQGKIAIIRGADPKKPGNILIEKGYGGPAGSGPATQEQANLGIGPQDLFAKTKVLSVPRDTVRTTQPVLKGEVKMSDLPTQLGAHIPLPPGMVTTNVKDAIAISTYSKQVGALAKVTSSIKAMKDAMRKIIGHEAWMVDGDVRATGVALHQQSQVYKALTLQYQDTFDKLFGGIMSPMDRALNNAIEQNIASGARGNAIAQVAKAHPELVGEARQTLDMALNQVKANSEFLAQHGINNVANLEGLRNAGVLEKYMQNLYLKRLMQRKEYLTFVKKQMPNEWERAVQEIASRKEYQGKYASNIESVMLDVLSAEDAMRAKVKVMPHGDARKQLTKRINMAQSIRDIIGEVDSASVRVAHSLASTQCLKNQISLWDELSTTNYWSPGPRADLGPDGGVEVPHLPIYGKAAGGRLHESMRYLVEQKDMTGDSRSFFNALSAVWKRNKVALGGASQWTNNLMRNGKGLIISGGISRPEHVGTFYDAIKMMMDYHQNPILNQNVYSEAIQNGTIDAGFGASEVLKNKAANKIMQSMIKAKGQSKTLWDVIAAGGKGIQGTSDEIVAAYDQIDKVCKFTAYLNIRQDAIANGMNLNDAAALANIRVTQSFPMFSMVAPVVERMRKGSMAVVAPFLSGKAEDLRINGTMIKRLAQNENGLAARLMWTTALIGGGLAFNREVRRANGITDAQAYAAVNMPKLNAQMWRPTSIVGPSRDEEGRMEIYDMSSWEDGLQSLQSHPLDPQMLSIIRNQVIGIQGDNNLPGQMTDMLASKAFNLHPLTPQMSPQYRPGENGVLTTLAFLAQNGMVPGFLTQLQQVNQKAETPVNPKKAAQTEVWTKGQRDMKLLGAPFAGPVGDKTEVGRSIEFKGNAKDMKNQVKQGMLNNIGDPVEQQRLKEAKLKALGEIRQNYLQSKEKK